MPSLASLIKPIPLLQQALLLSYLQRSPLQVKQNSYRVTGQSLSLSLGVCIPHLWFVNSFLLLDDVVSAFNHVPPFPEEITTDGAEKS